MSAKQDYVYQDLYDAVKKSYLVETRYFRQNKSEGVYKFKRLVQRKTFYLNIFLIIFIYIFTNQNFYAKNSQS